MNRTARPRLESLETRDCPNATLPAPIPADLQNLGQSIATLSVDVISHAPPLRVGLDLAAAEAASAKISLDIAALNHVPATKILPALSSWETDFAKFYEAVLAGNSRSAVLATRAEVKDFGPLVQVTSQGGVTDPKGLQQAVTAAGDALTAVNNDVLHGDAAALNADLNTLGAAFTTVATDSLANKLV
jgi:hypothetical protein